MAEKIMTLAEQVKELSLVNISGVQYLGKIKKIEGGVELTHAIPVADSFEESVANWIKAKNIGKLEDIGVEGIGATYSKKSFNEEQKMRIDIIAAKAEFAIKYAVAELQNSKF